MANSHDTGTRILHDLGILDSKVQSPRQQPNPDISETGSSNTRHDDSTQRLIDTSVPGQRSTSQGTSQTYGIFKEIALYSTLFILFGTVWLVLANIPYIYQKNDFHNPFQSSWIPSCLGLGSLFGSYVVAPFLVKIYALFIIQLAAFITIVVVTIEFNYYAFSSWMIAMICIGVAVGIGERFSYLYVYRVLDGSKRKFFMISAVIAFSILFSISAVPTFDQNGTIEYHPHVKREAGLPAINLSISEPQDVTPSYRPTKPSSAIGNVENVDTKTAENAEKRKLAEEKKANASMISNENEKTEDNSKTTQATTPLVTTTTTAATTTVRVVATKISSFYEPLLLSDSDMNTDNTIIVPHSRGRNRISSPPKVTQASLHTTIEPHTVSTTFPLAAKIVIGLLAICLMAIVIISFGCSFFWYTETLVDLMISADSHRCPSRVTKVASAILWLFSELITYGLLSFTPFIYATAWGVSFSEFPLRFEIMAWAGALFVRILFVAFSNFAITKTCLQIILGSSIVFSVASFIFSDIDICFFALISTGVLLSNFAVVIALHQQVAMNLSPYTTSGRYLFWACLGRCIGPLIYGKVLTSYPFQVVVKLTLAIVLAMLISFYYYLNNITNVARHQQLQDLTLDIAASPNVAANTSRASTSSASSKKRKGNNYALLAEDHDDLNNCLMSESDEDIFD